MPLVHNIFVAPTVTDYGTQCRIYHRATEGDIKGGAARDYQRQPDAWAEVGLMNSEGRVVCLEPGPWQDLKKDEPLCAGGHYVFDAPPDPGTLKTYEVVLEYSVDRHFQRTVHVQAHSRSEAEERALRDFDCEFGEPCWTERTGHATETSVHDVKEVSDAPPSAKG